MEILSYITVNILLFSSWYAFLFDKRESLILPDRLAGTFILGLTQIIATEMLLGVVFEKLFPGPLFFINLFVSVIVMIIALRAGTRGIFGEIRDEAGRFLRMAFSDPLLLFLTVLFAVSVTWMIFTGYLFPSYSWDALYYHLPMVGQIMQEGAIKENSTPSFIQQYINIFSKNVNLFFLWNIIFLKSDVIVDLSQLFFTIAGTVTIYGMALKMNIREKYAVYSAMLFFFAPVIILQSTVNYVDCAVSMLFLISVNFLLGRDKTRRGEGRMTVLLSGLTAGILLGSKPTGPLFIFVIACAVVGRELTRRFGLPGVPSAGKEYSLKDGLKKYAAWFILPVILTGGYWYARNMIFYGNPVYYMDVSIFGRTILEGLENTWVEPAPAVIENLNYLGRMLYVWQEKVGYYMYDSRFSGFGPLWFILFLPGIFVSVVYAATERNYRFLFITTLVLGMFAVHPRNWFTRYVIFAVGQGALSFGLVMECFSRRENILKASALLLALYTFLTSNSPCIMPSKIGEFLALPPNKRTLSRHKPFNIDTKVRDEYGYWIWLENNISAGDTLAYTFEAMTLDPERPFFLAPLWNSGFSNRVVYVTADDYRHWLDELERSSATYVLYRAGSREDRWIEKERRLYYSLRWMGGVSEKFRVLYSDSKYKIVQFNKG